MGQGDNYFPFIHDKAVKNAFKQRMEGNAGVQPLPDTKPVNSSTPTTAVPTGPVNKLPLPIKPSNSQVKERAQNDFLKLINSSSNSWQPPAQTMPMQFLTPQKEQNSSAPQISLLELLRLRRGG